MENFDITKESNGYPDLSLGFDGIISIPNTTAGRSIKLPTINKTVSGVTATTLNVQDASRPTATTTPQVKPKGSQTRSVKDIISSAVASHSLICPSDVKLCPDGKTQVKRDPNNKCQFKNCPELSEAESANYAFNQLFGYYPSAYELNRFIELWHNLGHQPTADEYKEYLQSLQRSAGAETTSGGGGGGGTPIEEKSEEVSAVVKEPNKWILHAGIAAVVVGIYGYLLK